MILTAGHMDASDGRRQARSLQLISPVAATAFYLERTGGADAGAPAMKIVDSATTRGTPVTLQIETERGTGSFLRGVRAETSYFDVSARGVVTLSEADANPPKPIAGREARIYVWDGKLVVQYNDEGTVRYKYLELTGTSGDWVGSSTGAP